MRVHAEAASPTAPSAELSFLDSLLKQLKLFTTNLAVDLVRDKQGILGLADRFPANVRATFRGLFECYVDQVRSRLGRRPHAFSLLGSCSPSRSRPGLQKLIRLLAQVALGTGNAAEAEARSVGIFKNMIKTYVQQLADPYEFPSYHTAMRSPFDYYALGNQYVGALIDWQRSVLANCELWDVVEKQLAAGENVVLLANHQSGTSPLTNP